MRNKQLGVTALGWLILLTPFAIVGYAGMRMAPIYLNYMKVKRALEQAGSELKTSGGLNAQGIKTAIDRHFEIEIFVIGELEFGKNFEDGAEFEGLAFREIQLVDLGLRNRGQLLLGDSLFDALGH